MINIERLTPDGWKPCSEQDNVHAAVAEANELCRKNSSTYRLIRSDDLICLIREQGIIWINANSDVMGTKPQKKADYIDKTEFINNSEK